MSPDQREQLIRLGGWWGTLITGVGLGYLACWLVNG